MTQHSTDFIVENVKPGVFDIRRSCESVPATGLVRELSNKTKLARSKGKIHLNCDLCGLPFETYVCWAKRVNRHYCSRACASEGKVTQVENSCAICNDVFLTKKSDSELNRKTTCSEECRSKKRSSFLSGGMAKAMREMQLPGNKLGAT